MKLRTTSNTTRMTIGCCLAAGGLLCAPPAVVSSMRSVVRDALRPGQTLVRQLARSRPDAPPVDVPAARDDQRVAQLAATLRQRELRIAALQEQLARQDRHGRFPAIAAERREPLVLAELLTARVLARGADSSELSSVVVDRGTADDVQPAQWILDASGPLVDHGDDAQVATGQPVYAGRCVVGRIAQAGRWTSSLQLITSPQYSGLARLARRTSSGLAWGAEGILEGMGDGLCRLTGIPDTQPVAVGDDVYTGGRSPILPDPMYYGRIERARLQPGATWEIVVRPAVRAEELDEVNILRATLNPLRTTQP